jgi:hypothetical protein
VTDRNHRREPSAGERLHWLSRTAKRWILAVVLIVVVCLVGTSLSYGVFSDSTANAQNVVSAGSMTQTNTAENEAIMGANDLVPGDSVEGTATIKNVGDASGDFSLLVTNLQDVPGPSGGKLSARLNLKVFEVGVSLPIYNGTIDKLHEDLGTWAPDEQRSYRFVVTFPEGTDAADNPAQKSKVTATFEWQAVQTR